MYQIPIIKYLFKNFRLTFTICLISLDLYEHVCDIIFTEKGQCSILKRQHLYIETFKFITIIVCLLWCRSLWFIVPSSSFFGVLLSFILTVFLLRLLVKIEGQPLVGLLVKIEGQPLVGLLVKIEGQPLVGLLVKIEGQPLVGLLVKIEGH